MPPSFHTADRQTYRRVVVVGALFCSAFVIISFSLRPRLEETQWLAKAALAKADRLVRTAGEAKTAD
jgi:hypothetical protein